MTSDLLELLACPIDGKWPLQLTVTEQTGGEIAIGRLSCPTCGRVYPITEGIPRLLPDPSVLPAAEAREKESERRRRDQEATCYDRNLMLRLLGRWEIPTTLRALAPQPNEHLLEIGCGTGRFTRRVAPHCRSLLAVDFSAESLRVARARTPSPAVQFIQADASRLPLRDRIADRALSCQMLEHLPTQDCRAAAVAEAARALRPGATFVASAYWHSPFSRLAGSKEGHHDDAIYYYRFTRAEFADLLDGPFRVESLTPRLVYVLLARTVKRAQPCPPGAPSPRIDHEDLPRAAAAAGPGGASPRRRA
jgi:ubiquinone/menaquinone biosynthesis C-methylase UbiE